MEEKGKLQPLAKARRFNRVLNLRKEERPNYRSNTTRRVPELRKAKRPHSVRDVVEDKGNVVVTQGRYGNI